MIECLLISHDNEMWNGADDADFKAQSNDLVVAECLGFDYCMQGGRATRTREPAYHMILYLFTHISAWLKHEY